MKRNEKGQFIKGANIKDQTGKRYGRLIVVEIDRQRTNRKTYWLCKCDCGNTKSVRSDSLGVVRSCGCLKKEQDLINFGVTYNHGLTNHRLFPVWNAMVNRCENSKSHAYKDYGGRGIKVCDEWHDVKKFIEWAENGEYQEGLTIERIDVNGNYEPSNCTWITRAEQSLNKRNSVKVTVDGVTKNLMTWVHELDIPLKEAWSAKSNQVAYEDLIRRYIA